MRIRHLISTLTFVGGLVAAGGGYFVARLNDDFFVGTVWMVLGIALMASAAIYTLAMDDPEARETALTTHRLRSTDADGPTIDLREPVTAPAPADRETISAR
jgi:hypothetical protein